MEGELCGGLIRTVTWLRRAYLGLAIVCRADFSSEHPVTDRGVEQQKWEDEEALAPEHEGETGRWRGAGDFRSRERTSFRPVARLKPAKNRTCGNGDLWRESDIR